MFDLSYYLHWSGNFHVTLPSVGQQICVSVHAMKRIGIEGAYVGFVEITIQQALELGFILPAETVVDAG
jgi:hypothetical protein